MTEAEETAKVRSRLGGFIKFYASLGAAFASDNAALVFDLFLYQDALRLIRGAEWFDLTDPQGAEATGISIKRYRDGRDHICGEVSNHLFDRQRKQSAHGIALYRANYDRIHAWLDANGFDPPKPASARVTKTATVELPKRQLHSCQNGNPVHIFNTDEFDVVVARAQAAIGHLECAGVTGTNAQRLAVLYSDDDESLSRLMAVAESTVEAQLAQHSSGRGQRIVHAPGLIVTRLRQDWEQIHGRPGQAWTHADPMVSAIAHLLTPVARWSATQDRDHVVAQEKS